MLLAGNHYGAFQLAGVVHCGENVNADRVEITGAQRFFHAEAVFDHHVVALADERVVDKDLGDGVHTVKGQLHLLPRKAVGQAEFLLIPPVIVFIFAEVVEVFAVEGVLLQSGAHKIDLNIAGNLRRDARHAAARNLIGTHRHIVALRRVIKGPCTVQFHVDLPPVSVKNRGFRRLYLVGIILSKSSAKGKMFFS